MAQNAPINTPVPSSLRPGWMTWSFDFLCAAYAIAWLGGTPPEWGLLSLVVFGAFAALQRLLVPIQNKMALLMLIGGLGGPLFEVAGNDLTQR